MFAKCLRLEDWLAARCRLAAAAEGVSENQYIANAVLAATERSGDANALLGLALCYVNRPKDGRG